MFDIVSKFNGRPQTCTKELFEKTLQSTVVNQTCREIETIVKEKIEPLELLISTTADPAGLATLEKDEKALWEDVSKLKKRLPAFCFQAHFSGGRRSNKSAEPSGLCMFDIDDLKDPKSEYLDTEPRLKSLGVVLAHITPSTRGLRYVFRCPAGMSITQAQQWFASQLGITQFDGCTKDLARISFAVPQQYVLYLDGESLFAEVSRSQVSTPITGNNCGIRSERETYYGRYAERED